MGAWGYYNWPTEPPVWDFETSLRAAREAEDNYYAEQESLDERAEQESVDPVIPSDWTNDWGAWLESGEIPVPNAG